MAILEILFIDTSKTLPKPSVFKLPKHEIRWSLFAKKKKKKKKKDKDLEKWTWFLSSLEASMFVNGNDFNGTTAFSCIE